MHADQTHGINDLRTFYIQNKKQINVYSDNITAKYLKKLLDIAFLKIIKNIQQH